MTPEEMKKFDRKVRAIQDPFGTGYKVLRRLLREEATKRGIPYFDLLQLYLSWKTIQE
ncbi:hypothetical protein [Caproiciproducens sp. LBM24188]|nr:hypothetical protein [Clostridiales bacterium]